MIIELEKKSVAFRETRGDSHKVEEYSFAQGQIINDEERKPTLKVLLTIGVFLGVSGLIYGGYNDYKVYAKANDLEEQVQSLQDEIEMLKTQANQPDSEVVSFPIETEVNIK